MVNILPDRFRQAVDVLGVGVHVLFLVFVADVEKGELLYEENLESANGGFILSMADFQAADEWNAGNTGCGELLVKLFLRVRALHSGELFRLISADPAAPEEVPAWCRLTGHRLLSAKHPEYWIQRKEN
jgi:tRNA 2-thiouridine synthesizing protein A